MRDMKFSLFFGLLAAFACLLPLSAGAQTVIDPGFNPNRIIEDADLLDYDSLSLPQIQNFLQAKNSYLASYFAPNAYGMTKTAAEIIYDAARNNYDCEGVTLSENPTEAERQLKCRRITTVNPKFLLILLQKEASLIENPSPTQSRLDWATGYGCPDNWACNPYYKGFGKQVNSAALQFLAYMKEPGRYQYRAGQAYTFTNPYGTISNEPMTVIPENQATAALYNYTPHVFNGNYNVYKLWDRYFPEDGDEPEGRYPDGSLLSAEGDAGIWLIEGGQKRPFLNYSAFISRFQTNQVLKVSPSELDLYPEGSPIRFADYSLVQAPDKQLYLLVGGEKRPFENLETFKRIGFRTEELEIASAEDLASYRLGRMITATSTYVTGALLQDITTGGVYYVENGEKAPLLDKSLLTYKFRNQKLVRVSTKILNAYPTISPILFGDGTLLKTDSHPSVYLISNGQKRPFANETIFKELGYKAENIITASSKLLYQYPLGEAIQ